MAGAGKSKTEGRGPCAGVFTSEALLGAEVGPPGHLSSVGKTVTCCEMYPQKNGPTSCLLWSLDLMGQQLGHHEKNKSRLL